MDAITGNRDLRSSGSVQEGHTCDRNAPATQSHAHANDSVQRTVIIHYHIFKNAGSSVDEMLRHNFGSAWVEEEFPGSGAGRSNAQAVGDYLRARPELAALSSHTALLPPPAVAGVAVFPIICVRHPIDRLYSAYLFERAQRADTLGARLAKERDFAGYLRALLQPPSGRQARDFQTARLAMNEVAAAGTEIERARRAITDLPFVGLVEDYPQSLQRLETLIRPSFPNFRALEVKKNVTRAGTLKQRLAEIRKLLGRELFEAIRAANRRDLKLYRIVAKRYALQPENYGAP